TTYVEQGKLVILPLPTMGRMSPVIWHTVGFMLGWERCFQGLRDLLRTHPSFYYLIHPADFVSPDELHPAYAHSLPRMSVPHVYKMARLDEAFATMKASGRRMVTLREAAAHHRANPAS